MLNDPEEHLYGNLVAVFMLGFQFLSVFVV